MIVDAGNKSVADPADVTVVGHDLTVSRFDEEAALIYMRLSGREQWMAKAQLVFEQSGASH